MQEIDQALAWLYYPQTTSRLDEISLQMLQTAATLPNTAGSAFEGLRAYCAALQDRLARAEFTVMLAWHAFRLKNHVLARQLLDAAQALYQRDLCYRGVIHWLRGWMTRAEGLPQPEVMTCFSAALEDFKHCETMAIDAQDCAWYSQRVADVQAALKVQISGGQSAVKTAPFAASAAADQPVLEIGLFRVVEEVPAGGFKAVGYQPYTIGDVSIDRVIIEGKPHRMINLRGHENLLFLRSDNYLVVKISGDSMNQAGSEGIDPEDFVLIRQQNHAENGDIVIAEIDGVDSAATIKRFQRQGKKKIILSPESSNPVHQPFEFDKLNEGFSLRGVALVLFKPLTPG